MPGARLKFKPESEPAEEYSACNEESHLELLLQRQLEEDVARIFDESIYSDLEVVCGKLKLLTHSCILKARTHKFYHKLQTILHVNIGRNTFDEIYSFIRKNEEKQEKFLSNWKSSQIKKNFNHEIPDILPDLDISRHVTERRSQSLHSDFISSFANAVYSTRNKLYLVTDAYTECNIKHQEEEIIQYIDLNIIETANSSKTKDLEEPEVFLTPKCVSPYVEKGYRKNITSSPSTELTKEYYALVPIEGNLLEKELYEQDALSNAFQSIIKSQTEDNSNPALCSKPTSLSLISSHSSKTVKHSNSCDILNKNCFKDSSTPIEGKEVNNIITSQYSTNNKGNIIYGSNIIKNNCDLSTGKEQDPAYSPDSLITDEPSSSSDYLSAAYTFSPGVSSSCHIPQINVGINTAKMENIFTLSDSGLENTAMLGSINSHKDVTLTDVSLSESTLHDLVTDDASNSATSMPSPPGEKKHIQGGTSAEKDNTQNSNKNIVKQMSGKSLKEEKQRQNEEIVIMESSSVSSETGSWESVYPPKFANKDVCEKFLVNERQYCLEENAVVNSHEGSSRISPILYNKSTIKSTSCFIDAASLADETEEVIKIQINKENLDTVKFDILPAPSQPVPCSTVKLDISPNDWSEGNDNEDSLEQADKKDPDSIQKDLSPTIFEMTPITEDSLCTNAFESVAHVEIDKDVEPDECQNYELDKDRLLRASTLFTSSTPNNSIMSLKTFKQYESEDSKSLEIGTDNCISARKSKENISPPILSGGVSVEDHLPLIGSSHENSPLPKWKLENVPIVSGAYVSPTVDNNHEKTKASSSSAWVVDMSIEPATDDSINISSKNSDDSVSEKKKNIFSMYIDLSEKTTLKDMPVRLSTSINSRKHGTNTENKPTMRNCNAQTNTLNDTDNSKNVDISNQSVTIFEKYESLCNDPNISISEIIGIPEKHDIKQNLPDDSTSEFCKKEMQLNNNKPPRLQGSGDKVSQLTRAVIQEECMATDPHSSDLFVKLSDLDKPVQKSELTLASETKEIDVRMTRSIPENNWSEQPISANSRSIEVISSFHSENALSLNRLFPHLKNEFSRSMPGSLSSRTRSPLRLGTTSTLGDAEEQASDISEVSSMQSSICRSGFGNSTTDSQTSSLIENCTSRLGQDLLRMFLEEIAPDVIVEVSGKRFKAHKCILSSRCQYFAGILSGGWVESLGNVIVLPPFSYNVVYFALCHIYSGLATIPDSVSIVELATIADMLGLEGLKEAIMFTLKAKYCHHFHKPCAVCIVGVLECFPLSSVYGLDDLYHKCLKWITKNFSRVWPTKAFATLPTDLLDKCYQYHIVNLTVDNLVDTVYGCGITVASLQNSRWAESVARMCRRLINAAAHFAAAKLVAVLHAIGPLPADAPSPARQALDECITAAIDWAPPDEACRAYNFLSSLIKDIRSHHYLKPDLITNGAETKPTTHNNLLYSFAGSWRLQCEGALVRSTPRVVVTQAFKDLPFDQRKRLRELGCIDAHTAHSAPCMPLQDKKKKSTYHRKPSRSSNSLTTRSVDIAHVRASFVPYAPKPVVPLGSIDRLQSNNDLRDFKKSHPMIPPKVRTTKAQEERAKFNKCKKNNSQDKLNKTSVAVRAPSFENTKPRYLEPRPCKDTKNPVLKKLLTKTDSSTESSRNSSPIQVRNHKTNALKPRQTDTDAQSTSLDGQARGSRPRTAEPSTDSLSESQSGNKYATYTKTKHSMKTSIESIISKCDGTKRPLSNGNKLKTKIPVYLNQTCKLKNIDYKSVRETPMCDQTGSKSAAGRKSAERKLPGSLMNATKSSSAKMVPKVVKDCNKSSNTSKNHKTTHVSRHHRDGMTPPTDIPMMERSGTFLKDEPTFGDKTTNIDIAQ